MNRNESLTLLKGLFTAEEAREVLISLFQAKINYHEARNFSSQVRSGCDDRIAAERLPELRKSLLRIRELVAQAEGSNRKMVVTSTVNIEFAEEAG